MNLQNFFNPKSVAVVGASADSHKVGYALVSNLLDGTKREIFPVTISEKEVHGLKTYASLKEITENIDLAVIAVRADIVLSILEECAMKKIQNVIIISAGFKEVGVAGTLLEEKITETAKRHGIAVLGPNCLGAIDAQNDFNASFAASKPAKGNIGFISQSGALGAAILDRALSEGVGFSKFVSLGNEACLSEIEFLEYFGDDAETQAILMYLENLSLGQKFMELAARISKTKPIVVLKAGRSTRGREAVMSHTGSLAPADAVFSAACRQAGVIAVESIREFFNVAKMFQLGIMKPLQKLIVLTNAGGPAVIATDLIDQSHSLSLLELSDQTKESLRKVLPTMAAFGNPVDIIGDALSERYAKALNILVEEKEADAIIVLLTPQMMTEDEATAKLLAEYKKKKPIIPVFIGGPAVEGGLVELKNYELVNFTFPKDAIEALEDLAQNNIKKAGRSPTSAISAEQKIMTFEETKALFKDFDLKPGGVLVKDKADLAEAMRRAGGAPYALKAMSTEIVHKTDMGAVQLNLMSLAEAETAWQTIVENVRAKNPKIIIHEMLIQSMPPGKETIIGMKRDSVFGPTLLFGLGGIFAEALKDTSLRVAPVTKEMALEMIAEIRSSKILSGMRGETSVNLEALADIIEKISALALAHPEVKEIDLNPVTVDANNAVIVDARVII